MVVKVAVIGGGPTGLVTGMGLARRGHTVVAVDRDHVGHLDLRLTGRQRRIGRDGREDRPVALQM